MYRIKEVAEITGVSVRTLHHYDQIGLLVPQKGENLYRLYSDEDIDRLQTILFYKVLGFSLKEIQDLLIQDSQDRIKSLLKQEALLKEQKEHLEVLLETIDKTIKSVKGEESMTHQEKFQGFSQEYFGMYEEEAVQAYGKDAVANAKTNIFDNPQMAAAWGNVFKELSLAKKEGVAVDHVRVQEQVALLYDYINEYVFDCNLDAFAIIGQTYVADERFANNIDQQAGEGTAKYASQAIAAFVEKN